MSTRYDIAIIGSGPAGLSAAINAKIRNKSFIVFGSKNCSNKLVKAHQINNYLGFPGKSGEELASMFLEHTKMMGVEITDKKVTMVYPMGDYYSIMANNDIYEATSVILTTGVQASQLLPGEEELLGRGVSYCATCDGNLYKGKVVAVIGYGKEEEEEVNFLAELASKVYYIPMYKEEVDVHESVEIIKERPTEIKGSKVVEQLVLKNQELDIDGLFILRSSIRASQLVPGLKVEENHVVVDRLMNTNLEGLYAAGDIVGKPYQYIKAAGEGNIAALSASSFVDKKKKEEV